MFSYGITTLHDRVSIFHGSAMIECETLYDIISNHFTNRKVCIVIFKVTKRLKYK